MRAESLGLGGDAERKCMNEGSSTRESHRQIIVLPRIEFARSQGDDAVGTREDIRIAHAIEDEARGVWERDISISVIYCRPHGIRCCCPKWVEERCAMAARIAS